MIRFTFNIKLQIMRDYMQGRDISFLMETYAISQEELDSWCKLWAIAGRNGLKSTKLQAVRRMQAV